jgi:hypothetical protein
VCAPLHIQQYLTLNNLIFVARLSQNILSRAVETVETVAFSWVTAVCYRCSLFRRIIAVVDGKSFVFGAVFTFDAYLTIQVFRVRMRPETVMLRLF